MEGSASTGLTTAPYHANGTIELRDPDTGVTIKEVTWGGAGAGVYTPGANDATFVRFSRNLASSTIEVAAAAIQINQCLKCHDTGGATNASARIGANALQPFGFAITGHVAPFDSNGSGNVVDVAKSFLTTNAAYHPVSGKGNNWYAKLSRMASPWNTATRGGTVDNTSWGHLITCWDCHAASGASGVQTSTVTAHGGAVTLRAPVYAGGATAALNLCVNCHVSSYASTGTSHGAGSAFSAGNNNMDATTMASCAYCHAYTAASGGTAVPALASRPLRAENVHGVNDRDPVTAGVQTWTAATVKPFAFIRNTLSNWAPATVGGVAPANASTCSGSGGTCDNNMGNSSFGLGGTY
jgi:hypothetical protein